MNHQRIAKKVISNTSVLELHSIFYTIQGEGPFAGEPAVFVRLAGCNLQCPFCDTDYTSKCIKVKPEYIFSKVRTLFNTLIYNQIDDHGKLKIRPLVVITGGEPLRQYIGVLIEKLVMADFRVQIETNGTMYDPSINYRHSQVTVVCSPKTGSVNKQLQPYIDVYKYVIHAGMIDSRDGLPIEALGHSNNGCVAKPHKDFTGPIYIQPIDVDNKVQNKIHLNAVIKICQTYGYTLGIQIHKIIDME